MSEEGQKRKLAELLRDILLGSADLGLKSLPALAAFGKFKAEKGWKQAGFKAWLESDPEALLMVLDIVSSVKEKIPEDKRNMLIMALGGTVG